MITDGKLFSVFSDFIADRNKSIETASSGHDWETTAPDVPEPDQKQKTKEWFMSRIGKFTGSTMPNFMKNARDKSPWGEMAKKLIYQVVAERSMTPGGLDTYVENMMKKEYLQTTWGNNYEDEAREAIEKRLGREIKTDGFKESPLPYFGSSVDGIIGDTDCVEIKCPFDPVKHEQNMGMPEMVTEKHEYFWQMQAHLLATGMQECIFASYDSRREEPENLKIMICDRDEAAISQMSEKLEKAEAIVQHRLISGVYDFDL